MGKWELRREISEAVDRSDLTTVRQLWDTHPELRDPHWNAPPSWLAYAALKCSVEMVKLFLELGIDVNHVGKAGGPALESAILSCRLEVAHYLISRGADVNLGRPLLQTILCECPGLEFARLLVEHGVEINQTYSVFGDEENRFSALSFAVAHGKQEIAEYLRSQGGLTTEEIQQGNPVTKPRKGSMLTKEVVSYFEEHFGAVEAQSLIEIVPTDPSISVHVIKPDQRRNHVTLFTTGLSVAPMTTPKASKEFQFAELFIQLPGNWPLTKSLLEDPKCSWPVEWLRKVGKYPQQHQTWLGGPATIITNDDPPQPLFPQTKFTSMLLLAEHQLTSSDGKLIRLYRMLPLYTEERELERSQGIAALLNAFDAASIPFVVDLNRPNVGLDL